MGKTSLSVFPPELLKSLVATNTYAAALLWMTGSKNIQAKLQQEDIVVKFDLQQFSEFDKPVFPSIASKFPFLREINVSFHLCTDEMTLTPDQVLSLPSSLEFLKLDIPAAFSAFRSAMNQDPGCFPMLKSLFVRVRPEETDLPASWPQKLENLTIAGARGTTLSVPTLPQQLISLSVECLTLSTSSPRFPQSLTFLELTMQKLPKFDLFASLPSTLVNLIINNPISNSDYDSWTLLPVTLRTLKLLVPNFLFSSYTAKLPRQLTSLTTCQALYISGSDLLALPPDLENLEVVDSSEWLPPSYVPFLPRNLKSASPMSISTIPFMNSPLEYFSVVSCRGLPPVYQNPNPPPFPNGRFSMPITSLTVVGLTGEAAHVLPSVSELTLEPSNELDQFAIHFIDDLPDSITTLRFNGYDMSQRENWIPSLPPKLTTLIVTDSATFSAIQSGFEFLPKTLTYLEAHNLSRLPYNFFQIIPTGLRTLKLGLFSPNPDEFYGIDTLTRLETLELTSIQDDIPISEILCSLPDSLTYVKLYFSSLCTSLATEDFKSLPSNLRFLWLPPIESAPTNLFQVTPRSLKTIVFGAKIRHRDRSRRIKDVRLI